MRSASCVCVCIRPLLLWGCSPCAGVGRLRMCSCVGLRGAGASQLGHCAAVHCGGAGRHHRELLCEGVCGAHPPYASPARPSHLPAFCSRCVPEIALVCAASSPTPPHACAHSCVVWLGRTQVFAVCTHGGSAHVTEVAPPPSPPTTLHGPAAVCEPAAGAAVFGRGERSEGAAERRRGHGCAGGCRWPVEGQGRQNENAVGAGPVAVRVGGPAWRWAAASTLLSCNTP